MENHVETYIETYRNIWKHVETYGKHIETYGKHIEHVKSKNTKKERTLSGTSGRAGQVLALLRVILEYFPLIFNDFQ